MWTKAQIMAHLNSNPKDLMVIQFDNNSQFYCRTEDDLNFHIDDNVIILYHIDSRGKRYKVIKPVESVRGLIFKDHNTQRHDMDYFSLIS